MNCVPAALKCAGHGGPAQLGPRRSLAPRCGECQGKSLRTRGSLEKILAVGMLLLLPVNQIKRAQHSPNSDYHNPKKLSHGRVLLFLPGEKLESLKPIVP